jgi:hypothetical protein
VKTKKRAGIVFVLMVLGMWVSCDNPGNPDNPFNPHTPITPLPDPVDSAFWFGEIYDQLIIRVGNVLSDGYPDITDPSGVGMGQVVNVQYVCDAINAKWGAGTVTPVVGEETRVANCEYLLKMIDKANGDRTSFGTSEKATKQVVDKTAVNKAVDELWVPGDKFVAVASGINQAAYSLDGIIWTETTLPSSIGWRSVTYGNGKFVTVSMGTNKAACSYDGITWIETTMPSSDARYKITYGNGKFVAIATSYSNKAAYSTDGINWIATTMPGSVASWGGVTYGGY